MATEFTDIVKAVDKVIADFSVPGKWGLPPKPDPTVPFYIVNPAGNPDDVAGLHKLFELGRYGNWVGDAFGGGKLSPGIDLTKFVDLTNPDTVAALEAKANQYLVKNGIEGIYWQNPQTAPRDAVDSLGRFHDLLYGKADDDAAARMLKAAKAYANSAKGPADKALLEAERLASIEDQTRDRAGADVWWLANTNGVVGDNPYAIALKNIGDIVFGLQADRYFIQHLDIPPAEVILHEVGGIYGSRLGQLIAGEDPFTPIIASALGRELGEGLADLLSGKNSLDLGDSLLELFDGGLPLTELFEGALREFGIDADNAALSILSRIATTLIGDAAEALGLEGVEEYVFTQAGEALAHYLTRILSTGDIDNLSDFVTRIGNDLDFSDIANFLVDLALDYVTNDFVSDLLADVRGLVDVDSAAEAIVADISSVIGSIIGSIELPWFGGQIGSTIGYILGSIQFEVLNFISFGLFEDFINLFVDDPEPQSMFYVGLDADTGLLEVIGRDYKRDGIEQDQILKIFNGNMQLNDAYIGFVNGIIQSIGGTADGSFFFPIQPRLGGVDPNVDYLNHAMIGFDTDKFYTDVYWGGNRSRVVSNDPQTIISNAIAYELSHLIFYGGDLAQIRALNQWEASLFSELPTPALPPELADIFAGLISVPGRPRDPKLGLLGANLQVAQDYRLYLDNSETINYLMMQAPQSSFALGWIATLIRAAELGLNAPYVGSPHGGAGTAAGETILSADGNDLLFGNGGDDLIKSYGGDDQAYGGDGNDEIRGGSGRDTLVGDAGDDLIDGGDDGDSLYGGSGDDEIRGGRGADLVLGDAGADRLFGGAEDDSLFGFDGNDLLAGEAGDDEMAGEAGDDALDGGLGNDVLYGDGPGTAGRDLLTGGDGDDLAHGGAGDDRITGDAGADRLYGDEGADEVEGGEGDDRIQGGAGNDRLDGGAGADRIVGDAGDDLVVGGAGDDLLYGLAGVDTIDGGGGRDRLFGDDGNDRIDGGDGDDVAGGWKGDDRLVGGQGDDQLSGQDGSDELLGGDGDDILYGDRAPASGPLAHSEAEIIAAARARLGGGDFTIIYQGPDYSFDALRTADHDLIVVNPAKSAITGALNSEQLWTTAEVDGIEAGGKSLVAYLNVAKINDFTNYWNAAWTKGGGADDPVAADAPAFLAGEDAGFDHTRLVNFWEDGWRDLLATRIATIVDQGFSGIFLDDVLEYFIRRGDSAGEIAQAAREMRDLVIDLVATARSLVAARSGSAAADSFLIVINGAPFLIQDTTADGSAADAVKNAAFYDSLDGFLAENYFSQDLGYAVDQAVAEYGARGIALLSVDTDVVTEEQRIGIERAAVDAGFLPEVVPDADFSGTTARFQPGFGDVASPGDDRLDGGRGNDVIDGGAGTDTAAYESISTGPVTVDLRLSGAQDTGAGGIDTLVGIENLVGSAFGDTLTGNDLANYLGGGAGADTLAGGAGDDLLDGGTGADTMRGGAGNDAFYVDNVGDAVEENAGEGVDEVRTSLDSYSLLGSWIENLTATTNSAHDFRGSEAGNVLTGSVGNDTLRLQDGGGDIAHGGGGNDVLYFGGAFAGGDVADGGEGRDVLILQGNYILALSATGLVGIESISLQSGARTTWGDTANNFYDYNLTMNDANVAAGQQLIVNGQSLRAGEDFTFDGSAESDGYFLVYGGNGVDTLKGGAGNDAFFFEGARWGAGDSVDGSAGRDALIISSGSGVNHFEFGANALTGIESISLNNRYTTDPSQKPSYELVLSNGNVAPGATLIVNGSSLADPGQTVSVDGSAVHGGNLILFGGRGGDVLKGGDGADLIQGGEGIDVLAGGAGADTFRYAGAYDATAQFPDRILDFVSGVDKIDLTRIDADLFAAGDQAFHWIGSNAFTGGGAASAGELRAWQFNGSWYVEGDMDGNGSADLVIQLTIPVAPPVQGDFLL
jgi:uncharacterized protein (TIGR01370 family)